MDSQNKSLVDKIEEVKAKINEFEEELGINSIDLEKIDENNGDELIKKVLDYKEKINDIQNDIISKKDSGEMIEEPDFLPKSTQKILNLEDKESDKDDTSEALNKIKQETMEVNRINDLLEKLKKSSIESRKAANKDSDITPAIQQKDIPAKPVKNIQAKTEAKPVLNDTIPVYTNQGKTAKIEINQNKKVDSMVQNVRITENDLNSMSELISKLDGLLRSNKEIADKLNELLKDKNSQIMTNTRSAELIRKLALLGTNN